MRQDPHAKVMTVGELAQAAVLWGWSEQTTCDEYARSASLQEGLRWPLELAPGTLNLRPEFLRAIGRGTAQ